MNCPKCGTDCCRDEVDVGVGIITGPYGCPGCGWSENEEYDLSTGANPVDERGGAIDQYGGYHPPGSSMALAHRLAEMGREQMNGIEMLVAEAREFIRKVEAQEARSVRSYEGFKAALKQYEADQVNAAAAKNKDS